MKYLISILLMMVTATVSLMSYHRYQLVGRWRLIGEFCTPAGKCKKKSPPGITEFKSNSVVIISGEVCWFRIIKGTILIISKHNKTGTFKINYLTRNRLFITMISERHGKKIRKIKYNALFSRIIKKR